ncbi:MAG: primosomal protein N', partial [Gammaproteobacteria bacterium]|nr:primosomal protein N' [Gammaproteobacteria bacterium]
MSDTPKSTHPVLKVAVNVPLSREFDYLPATDAPVPAPGSRVLVPFGSRQQVGLVLRHASESSLSPGKIRRCSRVLDQEPVLSDQDLQLIRFTSDYYHHPIGEVVAAALPALLRQGKPLHPVVEMIAITDLGEDTDIEALA